jgi:hypothetical protein
MSQQMSPSHAGQGRPIGSPGWFAERGKRPGRGARMAGYAIAIVVNLVLIAVARAIPSLGLSFVTPDFDEVLPAIERSLVVAVVANAILCAYDAAWFGHLARVVMNAFALTAAIAIARVFPFDFGAPGGDGFARLLAVLVAIAVGIAIVAEAVKMVLALAGRAPEFDE